MTPQTIGYLLLPINAILFTGLFVVNKEYGKRLKGNVFNALLFAVIAGSGNALVFFALSGIQGFRFDPASLSYAALYGLLFVLTQISGVLAASKQGNMSFYSQSFMLGGMILPFFYGVFWAKESASPLKIIAIVLMVISLVVPLFDSWKAKGQNGKMSVPFFLLCLLALLSNGTNCVILSAHSRAVSATSPFVFTGFYSLFTAVFAGLGFGIAWFAIPNKEEKGKAKLSFALAPLLLALLYGLLMSFGSYTGMEGVMRVDASMFFPVSSGICIALSFFICRFPYKERMGVFATIGFVITSVATVLFLFS